MDWAQLADLIQAIGVIGLLAIAVLGGMRGVYIWKGNHEAIVLEIRDRLSDVERDRDEWKAIALRLMGATELAVQAAEKVVTGERRAA